MSMASKYLSFSSSLLDARVSPNKTSNTKSSPHNSNRSYLRCAARTTTKPDQSSSSSSPVKKRIWKEGEYPAVSEQVHHGHPRRVPIKNLKKKLERKSKAKGWVSTVTETLTDCINNKQWIQALEVFEMLREQSFYHPKEGTYVKLLVLLGRSGQPKQARQLFEEMIKEELEPTAPLYTALLSAYCRNGLIDEAFSILETMKSLPNCQPDVFTYSTLLKACVDAQRFDLVEPLYSEMTERGVSPNTVTQNTILSGYGRAGKFDDMERILSAMLQGSPECRPDVWTMNIVLSVFGNMGLVEEMERWYEKFRGFGIKPETRTFNILIGSYGRKRMYDKMSTVMEYMRKLEFPWTTSTYNNVIEAFSLAGDAKHMDWAFDQMRSEGMKADVKTFCCLIEGYANAGLFHRVISTVQLAGRFEIPENTSFFNAVISACAKAGDLTEMERVFVRMKEKRCVPNEATYSTMVEAYRKEGMSDKIYYLEKERSDLEAVSGNGDFVAPTEEDEFGRGDFLGE